MPLASPHLYLIARLMRHPAAWITCALVAGLGSAQAEPPHATEPPVMHRELLMSTLWMQTAHEYRFNTEQTYRFARAQLKRAIATAGTASLEQQAAGGYAKRPTAVVVDLDETVLDNSDFEGYLVSSGQSYNDTLWDQWLALKQARAVSGALAFTRAVGKSGAKIFYITNRACAAPGDCPAKASTMANMKALGFPRADDPDAFLLFNEKPEWTGDKVTRRRAVAQRYRIVMLLGDDLQDFMSASEARALRDGTAPATAVAAYDKLLGQRWFVLPNPVYGSWERALPKGLPGHYGELKTAPLGGTAAPPSP